MTVRPLLMTFLFGLVGTGASQSNEIIEPREWNASTSAYENVLCVI